MRAAIPQGPVFGPALFVSPRRARAHGRAAQPRARFTRRAIGLGRRAILVTNPACKSTPRRVSRKPQVRRAARRTPVYAGLLGSLLFSAAAFGLTFAVEAPRTLMSRPDYLAARHAIEAQSRAALGLCRPMQPAARGVCRAEARAQARVERADLDARYHGTVAAAADARLVRAKARFEVARARCNALGPDERPHCLQAARAEEAQRISQARDPGVETGAAT